MQKDNGQQNNAFLVFPSLHFLSLSPFFYVLWLAHHCTISFLTKSDCSCVEFCFVCDFNLTKFSTYIRLTWMEGDACGHNSTTAILCTKIISRTHINTTSEWGILFFIVVVIFTLNQIIISNVFVLTELTIEAERNRLYLHIW